MKKYQYKRENFFPKHQRDRLARELAYVEFDKLVEAYLKSVGFNEHDLPRVGCYTLGNGCYQKRASRH